VNEVHDRLAHQRVQNGGPGPERFNVRPDVVVIIIKLLVAAVDAVDAIVNKMCDMCGQSSRGYSTTRSRRQFLVP
jgi:hypothetical protein